MSSASTPPPGGTTDAVRVLAVPKRDVLVACFCGPLDGLLTHWTREGSVPCPGESECPSGLHKGRLTWKGYAPVRAWIPERSEWHAATLEITECLEELLRGRSLAGEVWALSRDPAKGRNGAVMGSYLETRTDAGLIAGFDFRVAVCRRYHTTAIRWGIPNPVVPRLVLAPIAAEPPAVLHRLAPEPEAPPTPEMLAKLREMAGRGTASRARTSTPKTEQPGRNGAR